MYRKWGKKNKTTTIQNTDTRWEFTDAFQGSMQCTQVILVLRIQHPNLPTKIVTISFSDGDSAIISYSAKSTASSAVPGLCNTIPEQQDMKLKT